MFSEMTPGGAGEGVFYESGVHYEDDGAEEIVGEEELNHKQESELEGAALELSVTVFLTKLRFGCSSYRCRTQPN